jgi:hypothetical protein
MNTRQEWQKQYTMTVLETDWSKMEDRIGAVETAIQQRLHDLSLDHGGTSEELHAIAETRQKLEILRADVARWRESKTPNTERLQGDPG